MKCSMPPDVMTPECPLLVPRTMTSRDRRYLCALARALASDELNERIERYCRLPSCRISSSRPWLLPSLPATLYSVKSWQTVRADAVEAVANRAIAHESGRIMVFLRVLG